jgi:hypothetical protein
LKALLDEDVPHQLRGALTPRHDAVTVSYMRWNSLKNGALLKLIEDDGSFDVFVTGDKNLQKQQSIANRPFAILVLSAVRWKTIRDHIQAIADAIDLATPGIASTVECGRFFPPQKRKPGGGSRT